jgi:predicted nucleic acid-binding protein
VKAVLDTSPVSYLILIGEVGLLPALYNGLSIPSAVSAELLHPKAPLVIRRWMGDRPAWLEVRPIGLSPARGLARLQAGEREAILLAEEFGADQVVLDDLEAREAALERGLKVTGLIGVLDQAATRGLIDLPTVLERLRRTNFHAAPRLLKDLLDRHAR